MVYSFNVLHTLQHAVLYTLIYTLIYNILYTCLYTIGEQTSKLLAEMAFSVRISSLLLYIYIVNVTFKCTVNFIVNIIYVELDTGL